MIIPITRSSIAVMMATAPVIPMTLMTVAVVAVITIPMVAMIVVVSMTSTVTVVVVTVVVIITLTVPVAAPFSTPSSAMRFEVVVARRVPPRVHVARRRRVWKLRVSLRVWHGACGSVGVDGHWELYALPAPGPNILGAMCLFWNPSNGVVRNPDQKQSSARTPLPSLMLLIPMKCEVAHATCISSCDPKALHNVALAWGIRIEPRTLKLFYTAYAADRCGIVAPFRALSMKALRGAWHCQRHDLLQCVLLSLVLLAPITREPSSLTLGLCDTQK
mmetsp:Transcript_59759/g.112753  ORF Transcript_59759/g.112753 Transcript_59759/m.112753 type:complete len:275 (+) Transcript_59759:511-1335(+)